MRGDGVPGNWMSKTEDFCCILHNSINSLATYGSLKKRRKAKINKPQTAQKAALESSQEAHLAAVICLAH